MSRPRRHLRATIRQRLTEIYQRLDQALSTARFRDRPLQPKLELHPAPNTAILSADRALCYHQALRGGVAQLGERIVRNDEVGGSNPLTSTTCKLG